MGGEKAAEEQAGRPREGRGQQMVQVEGSREAKGWEGRRRRRSKQGGQRDGRGESGGGACREAKGREGANG